MKKLIFNNNFFYKSLDKIISQRSDNYESKIDNKVKKIIKNVKKNGDKALIDYTKKFDRINLTAKKLRLPKAIKKNNIDQKIFSNFKQAIINIKKFHKLQFPKNYLLSDKGTTIKSVWSPLDSVGVYVPGGQAFYPSSLIMNVIPAKVAGVKRIVCVTPPSKNLNPYISALIKELGVDECYQIGGAQAIAALAYGTKTIKPVNKIFGPGNNYVALAKKQVFGKVGIDLIAGPSEIIVVADKKNNPNWVASDLLAQAEHDVNSQSILITDSNTFGNEVINKIHKLKLSLNKKNIINKSISSNGILIIVNNILQASEIINYLAPEHLHLHTEQKNKLVKYIKNAGCIFMGEYASEAFGDYIIGTNHVLPTFGSAKFASGLGVLDFMKRNSIAKINKSGYLKYRNQVMQMAEIEGLDAHKLSVKIRQNKQK